MSTTNSTNNAVETADSANNAVEATDSTNNAVETADSWDLLQNPVYRELLKKLVKRTAERNRFRYAHGPPSLTSSIYLAHSTPKGCVSRNGPGYWAGNL